MADPKYENLPGIAYDQPDVYETGDLPEADQPDPTEEEENECIEQLHLSVKDSFNKFKGRFLTGAVDFSDRLSRKSRIGYRAGEWELAAEGEPETILERYNRLRCEFSELLEQVTEQQNKATESEKDEYTKLAVQINSTKKLLEELKLEEGEQIDPKAEKLKEYLSSSSKKKQGELVTAHLKLKPEVNELYKLLRQIDGISHSEILERMEALEALHNQASNFGKSLTELETLQTTIASGVQNNKELLQGVQEVFAHNVDSVNKEIKKLDERISKLAAA
ncbi:hypothetical protein HF086_002752 [Spodoptera exigua]|uniref:Dynactin subunit 2 n=1 Tax=Spodoptera exigua TaxID=7107 RepID=A0A922SCU0_SPOEX|nr:hypothetical protein HF086_002752 [Spodoptera exigua]